MPTRAPEKMVNSDNNMRNEHQKSNHKKCKDGFDKHMKKSHWKERKEDQVKTRQKKSVSWGDVIVWIMPSKTAKRVKVSNPKNEAKDIELKNKFEALGTQDNDVPTTDNTDRSGDDKSHKSDESDKNSRRVKFNEVVRCKHITTGRISYNKLKGDDRKLPRQNYKANEDDIEENERNMFEEESFLQEIGVTDVTGDGMADLLTWARNQKQKNLELVSEIQDLRQQVEKHAGDLSNWMENEENYIKMVNEAEKEKKVLEDTVKMLKEERQARPMSKRRRLEQRERQRRPSSSPAKLTRERGEGSRGRTREGRERNRGIAEEPRARQQLKYDDIPARRMEPPRRERSRERVERREREGKEYKERRKEEEGRGKRRKQKQDEEAERRGTRGGRTREMEKERERRQYEERRERDYPPLQPKKTGNEKEEVRAAGLPPLQVFQGRSSQKDQAKTMNEIQRTRAYREEIGRNGFLERDWKEERDNRWDNNRQRGSSRRY